MGLETGTYISSLNATNPAVGDAKTEGDDHIRLIKSTLLATFPNVTGAVTATHTQINSSFVNMVNPRNYGATGDGVTDDTTAIQSAITYAKTLTSPKFILDTGNYKVSSTLQFDLPDGSSLEFNGTITSSVSNASAVILGTASGNKFWQRISGLKVNRTAIDYTGTSVGIELLNLAWCEIDVRAVSNFRYGVKAHGNGYGFTYNNVHLGYLHDNRLNLWLAVSNTPGGYCNECNWFGGSFNHSSGYDVATYASVNLQIDHDATNSLNNHRFWGPSFEDAHASSSNTTAATINGEYNVIYHCRMERITSPSTYLITFTANASHCGVVGSGFSLANSNISDSGNATVYETNEGLTLVKSVPASSAKAVLKLMGVSSSSARLLQFLDTAGLEKGYVDANGYAVLSRVTNGDTLLMRTSTSLVDGTAAATATLTNSPAAGNPTKWIAIDDNGTTRYIPAW